MVVPVGYQDKERKDTTAGILVVLVLVGVQDKEGNFAADVLHVEVVPVGVHDKDSEDAADCLPVVVVPAVNHRLHLHPHHWQVVWVGILQEVVSETLEEGSGLNSQLLCGCSTRTKERMWKTLYFSDLFTQFLSPRILLSTANIPHALCFLMLSSS